MSVDAELEEFPDTVPSLLSALLSQERVLEADIEKVLNELQNDLRWILPFL
jgi:hypothetical protein